MTLDPLVNNLFVQCYSFLYKPSHFVLASGINRPSQRRQTDKKFFEKTLKDGLS